MLYFIFIENDFNLGSYFNNRTSSEPKLSNYVKTSNDDVEKLRNISKYINIIPGKSQEQSNSISRSNNQNNRTNLPVNSVNNYRITPTKEANADLILNILNSKASTENETEHSNLHKVTSLSTQL